MTVEISLFTALVNPINLDIRQKWGRHYAATERMMMIADDNANQNEINTTHQITMNEVHKLLLLEVKNAWKRFFMANHNVCPQNYYRLLFVANER